MPNCADNYGIGYILADDAAAEELKNYMLENGRIITGYLDCPTVFTSAGRMDLFLRTEADEEGKLSLVGLDTHSANLIVWEMRSTGIDITPAGSTPTEKLLLLERSCDHDGLLPFHILNSDVLPSYVKGDIIKIQPVLLPFDIEYHDSFNTYLKADSKFTQKGKSLFLCGELNPLGFMLNFNLQKEGRDVNHKFDDYVYFVGRVKKILDGTFRIGDEKKTTYLCCLIDTEYGEIEINHTYEQVDEQLRHNIRVGAVVAGTGILSGDVAILEYEKGFVRDFYHNLRLLRDIMTHGEAKRLRMVMYDDADYISDFSQKTFHGVEETIERFEEAHACHPDCHVYLARITQAPTDSGYIVGTNCLVIAYDDETAYESIAFLDVDEKGYIERIVVTQDCRYCFSIDGDRTEHSLVVQKTDK